MSTANFFNKDTLSKDVLLEWQDLLDTAAQLMKVPAGLITRVDGGEIEIFLSSNTQHNPYAAGAKAHFPDSGFYCEWAIKNRTSLLIPNALKDPLWADNDAAKNGMISYAGVPIQRPDGSIFGTICFLDRKENAHDSLALKMLDIFKRMIELSLSTIFTGRLLKSLSMIYPICSFCKKVQAEDGKWIPVERYIAKN